MEKDIRVALLQVDTVKDDLERNSEKMEKFVRRASEKKADIVILPELSLSGAYLLREKIYSVAEEIPGPTSKRFSKLAKELGLTIVAGIAERTATYTFYNSAFLAVPSGDIVGVYRKVHLPWSAEKDYFRPGSSLNVYRTDLCTIGILICWDICFPEAARILALKGAELIIDPSAWIVEHKFMFDISTVARAHENNVFVAGVNRVGVEDGTRFFGGSRVVNPKGDVIVQADNDEAVLVGDCKLSQIKEMRIETRYFRERVPQIYRGLLDFEP